MHDSVLAHVAASFPQQENLATSALAYILSRNGFAVQACSRATSPWASAGVE